MEAPLEKLPSHLCEHEAIVLDKHKGGHHVVRHKAGQYVAGSASTNTAESYFALLKRGVHGAFHHVSKRHLHRYCDEFAFRWNHREVSDGERVEAAVANTYGKRLVYRSFTG